MPDDVAPAEPIAGAATVAPTEPDWTAIVQHGTCEQCGLRASGIANAALAGELRRELAGWSELLDRLGPDTGRLRHRPSPGVWSALEYACHLRDVLALFVVRMGRVLAEDGPELGWWDHEAAAVEERYDAQDVAEVAAALLDSGEQAAVILGAERDDEGWERWATRRGTERFTLAGLGRFAVHEARHHRGDAARSASSAG